MELTAICKAPIYGLALLQSFTRKHGNRFHLQRWRKLLLIMRLTALLLLIGALHVSASSYSQNVSISGEKLSLRYIFESIKKQTGYEFIFDKALVDKTDPVTMHVSNVPLKDALDIALQKQSLTYEIRNKIIGIKAAPPAAVTAKEIVQPEMPLPPPTVTVQGIVTDENGRPMPGVSVIEKGRRNGVSTDKDGKFSIVVLEGAKLIFSSVGMNDKEVAASNTSNLKVMLTIKNNEIEKVIVSGYFDRSKNTFTGAASTFSGEDLRMITNQNVLSALSTLDPSFKLKENNLIGSDPNTMPDFQIRGASNINSSLDEKYKGSPNVPTFILDGFEVSLEKIYDLDPLRINTLTILKDAAALAIYGSRGANGVVVITTNAPAKGKLRTTYTGNLNMEVADLSDYHLLNAKDKLEYERLAGIYTPNSYISTGEQYSFYYNERLKLVQQGNNTDWIKKPVKKVGADFKNAINMEGGDNTFRYGVDLSYNPTTGVMKGSARDRLGVAVRLNYNTKNLRFFNQISFDNVKTTNSPYGSFSTYAYLNPYYNPYDENGNVNKTLYVLKSVTSAAVTIMDPMYNATINTKNESKYDNFIDNFGFEWNMGAHFKFNSKFSVNKKTQIADIFKPSDHTDFVNAAVKGSYTKTTTQTTMYEGTAGLNYNRMINGHLIVLNANYNVQQVSNDQYTVTASGFPNDLMDHIGMGLQYLDGTRPSGYEATSRLMGLLGNLNYSYQNRFLADLSIRYDGSSQFGSNKRWGNFWSAGLGWNLHKEKLFEGLRNVSVLRVRGSFGYTGNQNFYPYQSIMTYDYIPDITYDGYIGAMADAYGNPNLKWQRTQKRNVGMDFELFKGKLSGYVNYYSDYSKDVLVDVTMPPSLGFDTYKANLGEVENSGYEVSLKATVLSSPNKKFYWNVIGSAVHNKNELRKISNALSAYNDKVDTAVSNKPVVRFIEGMSMNTIWVVKSLGIDPATGQEVFLDKNGNKTNVWSSADYTPYAKTDPTLEGTLGTNVGYKNFQLNVYALYRFGGYIYNQTLVDRVENVNPNQNVDSRVFYDRWKVPGDVAFFKGITNRTTTQPTSRFVEKDNVLELKSINLSYTFSQTPLLTRAGIERIRLTGYMNDVFRLSTVKAERGIDYPFAKHYALAFQVTF